MSYVVKIANTTRDNIKLAYNINKRIFYTKVIPAFSLPMDIEFVSEEAYKQVLSTTKYFTGDKPSLIVGEKLNINKAKSINKELEKDQKTIRENEIDDIVDKSKNASVGDDGGLDVDVKVRKVSDKKKA